ALVEGVELRRRLQLRVTGERASVDLVASLGRLGALWAACELALGGQLSPGEVLAVSMYLDGVIGPLERIPFIFTELEQARVALEKITPVCEQAERSGATGRALVSSKIKGHIALENVSYKYPGSASWALRGISLDIRPGETVAIVGESGCGKTTLANLIAGSLTPGEGRVLLDGIPLPALSPVAVRMQVGIVRQDDRLFAGTIAENIAFGDLAPDSARIEWAAEQANAREFIDLFPSKLNYYLAEGGLGLSAGQRQRLILARNLYRDPAVLILDEATSALDVRSEAAVTAALKAVLKGRTAIVIAHRFATIRNADRVFVIENGRLAEQGTPSELLAAGGLFTGLTLAQTAGGTA
ncbi:MAG TPA: ATP-binding cassette domain-containing protein, partial [Bdellovibrionales bacterium]|nr:ATP-binding cassette domain-containing protein [Bdellovibrionales bacterium]